LIVVLATVAATACGRGPELRPVSLPDVSRSDRSVQLQLRELHSAVLEKQEIRAADAELGAVYGQLGMVLQAAEYVDAAEPAYLNAQALMPDDVRWPYYLGHLFRRTGDTTRSIASFTRALELRPSDVPALVWLARTYADAGRAAEAEPLLARAQVAAPRDAAVLAARGQAALARGDHAQAATLLEEALAVNPRALSVHAPLAAAHRALGNIEKADSHLQRWQNGEIPLADPLNDELALSLRSAISYEMRGLRAFDAGRWMEAAALYRQGLALTRPDTPVGRSLLHKLGLTLYFGGDPRGALQLLNEAADLAPASGHDEPASRAHYSLGIILASAGRDAEAIEHLSKAVGYDSSSLQARMALADTLRRQGRVADALPHYAEALRIDPRVADARLGHALALVRLRRYVEARTWLEEGVRAHPDRPDIAHALARILSAAPDPRARDGQRAYLLANELLKNSKRTEIGETIAMALAELGEYNRAAAIQRGVIDAAQRAGLASEVGRMTINLRLYEDSQPCRRPWQDDDPVHRPGPPVSPQLATLISSR
jgi:tetratricopeptide (TPR) repeat protein